LPLIRVRFVSVYKTSNTQLVKEPGRVDAFQRHVSPGTIAVLMQSEARELSTLPALVKLGNGGRAACPPLQSCID